MARNRKRAKERQARRPQPVGSRRSRSRPADGAAAPGPLEPEAVEQPESIDRVEEEVVPGPTAAHPDELAPDPLGHAAPDVELADAQIALGSTGVADQAADDEFSREEGLVDVDIEEQREEERATAASAVTGERPGIVARLIGFLQGSWRELQRVQWPDRRQVAQATGVVLGFVIVAGVFLGLSDLVAQKLVNFIIYGN